MTDCGCVWCIIGGPIAIAVWTLAELARRWVVRKVDEGRERRNG